MKKYKQIIKMKTSNLRKIILILILISRISLSVTQNHLIKIYKKYIINYFNKIEKLIYNSACNIFDIS